VYATSWNPQQMTNEFKYSTSWQTAWRWVWNWH